MVEDAPGCRQKVVFKKGHYTLVQILGLLAGLEPDGGQVKKVCTSTLKAVVLANSLPDSWQRC